MVGFLLCVDVAIMCYLTMVVVVVMVMMIITRVVVLMGFLIVFQVLGRRSQ